MKQQPDRLQISNGSKILIALVMILVTMGAALAFSTLSLSRVDFSSNDAQLNAPAWLLTVVENGNEQYASGTFTPEQIVRSTDGAKAQQSLKIEIENTQNVCQYAFRNSYTGVYNLDMRSGYSIFTGSGDCSDQGGYYYLKEPWSFSAYCIFKTKSGQVTPLATPSTLISSTVKATANGQTVSGTVTNTGTRSVNLGTQAYASWEGNLVSGQTCPQPLDSGVMGAQANGQFLVTNKAAFDTYNVADAAFSACMGTALANTFPSHQDFVDCVNTYNAKAGAALQKTSIQPFAAAPVANGQVQITLQNLIQYPVITMRVKADWIGIVIPVGKPQIVSVTSSPFTESGSGTIRTVVKNIGDGQGSFVISAQCQAPTAQAGIAQNLKLAPGASGYVDIPVTGQASGSSKTATCTVTAQDINQPANKDTDTVTVTVNPIAICQPTALRCLQNTIQQCNQQGTAWIDSQTCLNGCTTQNGQPVCQNAEVCSTDSQCDDHDPTTVDACVGVVAKTCQHKVVPLDQSGFDFGKYGKLILWIALAVVFGVGATILGKTQGAGWYALHIVTVIGAIGAVVAFFGLFSTFAAILMAIGLVAILAGIALFAFGLLPYAIGCIAIGLIFVIGAIGISTINVPSWLGWF